MEPHDILDKVTNPEEFSTSNWKMRRDIIRKSLMYCAVLFAAIVAFIGYMMLMKPEARYDNNLLGILNVALSTIGWLAVSIIAAYIGGATFDTASYRSSISGLASTVANRSPNPVVTTTQQSETVIVTQHEIDPDANQIQPVVSEIPKRKRRIRPTGESDSSDPRG